MATLVERPRRFQKKRGNSTANVCGQWLTFITTVAKLRRTSSLKSSSNKDDDRNRKHDVIGQVSNQCELQLACDLRSESMQIEFAQLGAGQSV